MKRLVGPFAVLLVFTVAAFAQDKNRGQSDRGHGQSNGGHSQTGHAPTGHSRNAGPPVVGGGYIPQHGPQEKTPLPERGRPDQPGHPTAPHVDRESGHWVGATANPALHLDHPWEHGHFPGATGDHQIWRLGGGGPSRFWFHGYYFSVAPGDVPYCAGWLWDSDDVILYPDPDNDGWYLAYNVRLGIWVHVMYLGA